MSWRGQEISSTPKIKGLMFSIMLLSSSDPHGKFQQVPMSRSIEILLSHLRVIRQNRKMHHLQPFCTLSLYTVMN